MIVFRVVYPSVYALHSELGTVPDCFPVYLAEQRRSLLLDIKLRIMAECPRR